MGKSPKNLKSRYRDISSAIFTIFAIFAIFTIFRDILPFFNLIFPYFLCKISRNIRKVFKNGCHFPSKCGSSTAPASKIEPPGILPRDPRDTRKWVRNRCSDPPSTRAGGQDDVSLNKLPQNMKLYIYIYMYIYINGDVAAGA